MKGVLVLCSLFILLIGQNIQDARMLGLGGAYCTLSSGFRAVGINPANINYNTNWTVNIFSSKTNILNNFLNLNRYNELNGAHFDNPLSTSYYPKENISRILKGQGLQFAINSIMSIPSLNFSKDNYAFTSNLIFYGDVQFPQAFIDLMFFGNPIGKELDMSFSQNILSSLETSFSYAYDFGEISLGGSLKYLQGIYYSNMEELETPYFKTDTTAFVGSGNYLIKQGLGGLGFALDLGLSTKEFDNGMKYGVSIINAFSSMEWNNKALMNGLEKLGVSFPVREKEYFFFSFKIDSLSSETLLGGASTQDLFKTETYKVSIINVDEIPVIDPLNYIGDMPPFYIDQTGDLSEIVSSDEQIIESDKIVKITDGRVFIPTDNLNDLSSFKAEAFTMNYPTFLRFGVSKNFKEEDVVIAADIMTGFDNMFGNEEKWKISIGTEINKNPKIPLRLGITLGGKDKQRVGFGTGYNFGNMKLDIGYGYIGGFSLNSTRGADLALSMYYDYKKSDQNKLTFIDKIKNFLSTVFDKVKESFQSDENN